MDTFGEWLRQQREARKLTRDDFANRVGCSVAMLRKIEDDERRPSKQIAELIANTLDIPTGERETFIRVARGELGTDRLTRVSNLTRQPGISSSRAIPHDNIPVFPTPLIGREPELELLKQLLYRLNAAPMATSYQEWCDHDPRCNSREWHDVLVARENTA